MDALVRNLLLACVFGILTRATLVITTSIATTTFATVTATATATATATTEYPQLVSEEEASDLRSESSSFEGRHLVRGFDFSDDPAKRERHEIFRKRAKPLKNIFMGIYKNYKSTYLGNKTSLEYSKKLLESKVQSNTKNINESDVGLAVDMQIKQDALEQHSDAEQESQVSDGQSDREREEQELESVEIADKYNEKVNDYDENNSNNNNSDDEEPANEEIENEHVNENDEFSFGLKAKITTETSSTPATETSTITTPLATTTSTVAGTETTISHRKDPLSVALRRKLRKHRRKYRTNSKQAKQHKQRLIKVSPPVGGDDPLISVHNSEFRYKLGPGVNMTLDMDNDIINLHLGDPIGLMEILRGHWLSNDKTEEGRGKKYDIVSKVLPLFVLPFLIQSAIVPFLVMKLKLLLIKAILVGKLAIFLLIISALKNSHKTMQSYEMAPSYWASEPSRRSELAAAASSAAYNGYRVEGKPAAWIN